MTFNKVRNDVLSSKILNRHYLFRNLLLARIKQQQFSSKLAIPWRKAWILAKLVWRALAGFLLAKYKIKSMLNYLHKPSKLTVTKIWYAVACIKEILEHRRLAWSTEWTRWLLFLLIEHISVMGIRMKIFKI